MTKFPLRIPFASVGMGIGEAGAIALFLALACFAVMITDTGLLNVDSSWYLAATRRWMDGAVLYEGVIEINPPMMFYLTRWSLQLGAMAGLADTSAFLLFMGLVAMLCFAFAAVLLRRSALSPNQRGVLLCFVAIALLLIPLAIFGQREHVLMILFLPLALWMAFEGMCKNSDDAIAKVAIDPTDSPSPATSLAPTAPVDMSNRSVIAAHSAIVGIACALFALPGLLLKPHFFLLPTVAIGLRMVQNRTLSPLFAPSNIVLGLGAVGFLLFIWLVHPLYIENIVPLTWLTYVHPSLILLGLFSRPAVLWMIVGILIVFIAIVARAGKGALWQPSGMLASMALGGAALYVIQGKALYYHMFPAHVLMVLAVGVLVAVSSKAQLWQNILYAAMMIGLPLSMAATPFAKARQVDDYIAHVEAILAEQDNPQNILVLSASFDPSWPMVNETGLRWTSRYPSQWLLFSGWYWLHNRRQRLDEEAVAKLESMLADTRLAMVDDFIAERPDIVIIDKREMANLSDVSDYDFLPFLRKDPRFVAAWRGYHMVGVLDPTMTVYARKDLTDDKTP